MGASDVEIQKLMEEVAEWYEFSGFDTSVSTLMIGLMEEVGELAQAILLTGHCPDYLVSDRKKGDGWDHAKHPDWEIGDVITYLLALCNALGIEPYFWWKEPDERTLHASDSHAGG